MPKDPPRFRRFHLVRFPTTTQQNEMGAGKEPRRYAQDFPHKILKIVEAGKISKTPEIPMRHKRALRAHSQFHLKTRSGFRDRGIARVFVDRRKRPAKPPSCQSKIIFQPSVAAPFKPSRRIKLNQFSLILCYRYSIVLKKSAIPLRQTP